MKNKNKSILVVDTPEVCLDCDFCREINEGVEACCMVCDDLEDSDCYRMIDVDYCQNKPKWCPLCDMPEEKVVEPESMNGVYGIENARRSNFQKGWNTCINKILLENCIKRTRWNKTCKSEK